MRIVKTKPRSAGTGRETTAEEKLEDIQFNVFKFNNRERPADKNQIMIIGNLSEFGCESLAIHYCIPRLAQANPTMYKIVVGWYGREYLYRHLVDEYWEVKEEHQWLREFCRAFHNESRNLTRLEKKLTAVGSYVPSTFLGNMCLGNICNACKHFWGDGNYVAKCVQCGSMDIIRSLFGDIPGYRRQKVPVPRPSPEVQERANKYLRPRSVGVFARARKTWGRNLPPEYYEKLIYLLELEGYNPIWLGEKQSTLPCPVPRICDFSRLPECKDLELTLAIISKLEFTVQYWTASTRLAAMMGVPYLLFESPDQICGAGQEGMRMALTTDSPQKKKLVISHYLSVLHNQGKALEYTKRAMDEMQRGNWNDIIGQVEQPEIIRAQMNGKDIWSKM
jgi:hypothetical protein